MIIRQLFDAESSTYTYLLACDRMREALLLDPVKEKVPTYLALLAELGLKLVVAVDTHVHADHVTALGDLREATGCATAMGEPARAPCVSRTFRDLDWITFGYRQVIALATPGHTDDSFSFLLRDGERRYLFTGDTLLIRGTGRTDFQNGSASAQYDSLFHTLLSFPDDTVVYPGHDYNGFTSSTIGEERAHNPRLRVASKEEYVRLMDGLGLPTPKRMDVAVPANQSCGQSS